MSFTLEITKNGKDTILFNNHKYRETYSLKNGDVVWRCLGKSCKATIKTNREKSAIYFANETHSGKHPVTMRALTPTTPHKRQRLSFTTPASVSESSSNTPMAMCTPDPPTTTDTSVPALPSRNSQETPPPFLALQVENTALKDELARVREERQTILDHSAESDIRLLQFTDTIFMAPTSLTATKEAHSPNNKAKQTKDIQNGELNKLRTKIEELEETIKILRRPCESCIIMKEEGSNMINSIRCLEEENNLLKKKLCTEPINPIKKLTFQTVLKNSFDVLGEEEEEDISVSKEDKSFITVQNKKKRSKKKQHTNSNKNKIVFKQLHKTRRDEKDKCSFIPFKKVTVMGDSHVRNLATLLKERTKACTSISGVCKPGAGLLSVKPTLKPPRDHCYVLMAGTNDVDVGREDVIFGHLEEVLLACRISSKVLVLTLPTRHDLPPDSPVHNTVRMVNNYISKLCHRHQGVEMLDVSSIARRHFTSHGLHLRHSGKRLLASRIVEWMANMQPQQHRPQVAPTPPPPAPVAPETGTRPAQPHTLPYDTFADALKSSKLNDTGPQMDISCDFLGTSISRVKQN